MSAIDLKKAWEAAVLPPQGWQGDLFFYNEQGKKIRYGYAPAIGEKKGTVVLTHGYAEHIDLYYETVKKYQKMGYEVWGMDWQGHGLSQRDDPSHPLRPSTAGMERHVGDLNFFVENLVKSKHDPNTPLIMSTHSMGGNVGLLYLKKHPDVFDGAIMSAPMYDIYRLGLGSWARPGIKTIFNAASRLGLRDTYVPTVEDLNLSRHLGKIGKRLANIFNHPTTIRGELREMVKDLTPNAQLGRPTFGWIASAFKTIDETVDEKFLKSIKTPILIGSAENEDLVDNEAHARAARLMPNAKHVTIKDARHGLWFEKDGPFNAWWGNIDKFVATLKPRHPTAPAKDKAVIAGSEIERPLDKGSRYAGDAKGPDDAPRPT